MDGRPIVWDAWNRRHIERDHPERRIQTGDVEEALHDADAIEAIDLRGTETYHVIVGQTALGRVLVVVWVDHPRGRYPIHARQAGRRVARRYFSERPETR